MFEKAVPVWLNTNNEKDKLNTHLVFRCKIDDVEENTKIKITCADRYKLYINGAFAGFGPAVTAFGYGRVDEYDILPFAKDNGFAEIVVYVAGFYCKSLASVFQQSYFVSEIVSEDKVLMYTGRDFECFLNTKRLRKVERFSVQRHFQEIYDESKDIFDEKNRVEVSPVNECINFIPRRAPYAHSIVKSFDKYMSYGDFTAYENKEILKNAYSFDPFAEEQWGVFEENEISLFPFRYVRSIDSVAKGGMGEFPLELCEGQWLMADMGCINAGFLKWSAYAESDSDVVVAFTEAVDGDTFSFVNINMQTVFEYKLTAGIDFEAESFEPYTYKNVAFFVKKGKVTIKGVGIRTFECDMKNCFRPQFENSDFADLYDSAVRTFSHNAVDILMDCPSRERAGWLCDSYFTAKAEYYFFGKNPIEEAFLENYLLYTNRGEFPQGVLPMCYPSDPHNNNKFIPQWNMWYVLEVCDYLKNRNPKFDKTDFESTVFGVVNFLSQYENDIGLLENLPSWNFVEWSSANTWTADINFPTNMLYSGMLESVAEVYELPELKVKADKIRSVACNLSFDGEVFTDNAVRKSDGTFERTKNVSEACQYYFVLFGKVDLYNDRYASLLHYVKEGFEDFNPLDREFCPINAFIGLYLRMNVLHDYGFDDSTAREVKGFFVDMCRDTGTLWESKKHLGMYSCSLDHGFASYVATILPTKK